MNRTRGFTLIELLVVIAIIALLIGLLLPALAKAQRNAKSLRDKAQIKQIHQSMLTWANNNDEILPTPGLIDRLADVYAGQDVPGAGPENFTENNTANLYSSLIMQEYFNTDIVIGPTEVNPIITEYKEYNYAAYDPTNGDDDQYWDPEFQANLESTDPGDCNVSYYHLCLVGQRKRTMWRNSTSENDALIASRAPHEGTLPPSNLYNQSYTLLLHGPKKEWQGNVCYADNHTEVATTFTPALVSYEPKGTDTRLERDNIYAHEFDDYDAQGFYSGDAWLLMYDLTGAANDPDQSVTIFEEELRE
jgi:prepilin-type N-terminal cleavage/methylation domain-containing protein